MLTTSPFRVDFRGGNLAAALNAVTPVAGRDWILVRLPAFNPAEAIAQLPGVLAKAKTGAILRVEGTAHWIFVDRVLPNGDFLVHDPRLLVPQIYTPSELAARWPNGEVVYSSKR